MNIEMEHESFMINRERAIDYLNTRTTLYIVDAYAGHDPAYRVRVRIVCERPYHALFMKNMLIEPPAEDLADFSPDLLILNAGCFPANRYVKGVTTSCSVREEPSRGLRPRQLALILTLAPRFPLLALRSTSTSAASASVATRRWRRWSSSAPSTPAR